MTLQKTFAGYVVSPEPISFIIPSIGPGRGSLKALWYMRSARMKNAAEHTLSFQIKNVANS